MKELSTSLLFQFSIACFVIIFTIVLVIGLVFTERLDANAGIGFLVLSFALIMILLNGSRTISQQQSDLLATSKSGTLLLRRDQGDMAVL
jgi:hypothetical protein